VRAPFVKTVYATNGPSVNIATGIGGRRCSKRGSVSLNFKVKDTSFRIINMHLAYDSFANRMRDLSKILAVHKPAMEDQGTNIFLVGAFNFS
jgi:endonuclease/exonuclease/phosphatase family metal-dependent hydrolase